nr:hypothetical protein [Tanacetum cinerariifolium]
MGIAPKNSTIRLNTKTSLKGLISASPAISHSSAFLQFIIALAVAKNPLPTSKGDLGPFFMKLTTGRLIDGFSCGGIDIVIKDLDLEPKIDAMMRDFLDPSQWKELSKETSSKILPCGDGSCWKMFKPIASLIAKEKLK